MNKKIKRLKSDDVVFEVKGLSKTYQSHDTPINALQDVNLIVRRGEMMSIVGPSGSGKSTLLFVLGLLLRPTKGRYHMLGRDVLSLNRKKQAALRRNYIGFVFQSSHMVESCSVYENMELPLIYADVAREKRSERIFGTLEQVHMAHRLHHPAVGLSGGERQRVGIARALVNRPEIILADEPTGQLDKDNAQNIMDCFEEIAAAGQSAVIVVTHDHLVAARCPRVCRLEDGVLYES